MGWELVALALEALALAVDDGNVAINDDHKDDTQQQPNNKQ
jgi:hypothetical protein